MSDIVYRYGGKTYLNLTNQCPCACVFCIRTQEGGLGANYHLWHAADPSWEELEMALERYPFQSEYEVVFCGYGEPFCALELLRRSAKWLRDHHPHLRIRVNTNGLGDLINLKPTAHLLEGLADAFSISLNAPTPERYVELTQPIFGAKAFDAMLRFAQDACGSFKVTLTAIEERLSAAEIAACDHIAQQMGAKLRLRTAL